jgi:penicillin-binding protein 1A
VFNPFKRQSKPSPVEENTPVDRHRSAGGDDANPELSGDVRPTTEGNGDNSPDAGIFQVEINGKPVTISKLKTDNNSPTSSADTGGEFAATGDVPPPTGFPASQQKVTTPWQKVAKGVTGVALGTVFVAKTIVKPFTGKNPVYRKPWFWMGTGTVLVGAALGCAWLYVDRSVSKFDAKNILTFVRPDTMTVKAQDGTILLQTGSATRQRLKLWQMPPKLRQAFIAIEDRRFYEHDGVDYKGVTRAMWANITRRELAEGASSITQQVARMVYLDQEKNFWRKLREIRLAQKIGAGLTKDQVLENYLNMVYLGEGTYGVGDAAWVYFSKRVDELTLAEMATLAALPPAPNDYSPYRRPKFAEQRRNLVLQRMQEAGFITAAEFAQAKATPLTLKRQRRERDLQVARYFTKYVELELPKILKPEVLKQGGLTVETTLNPQWQERAEEVVNTTVRNNRGSFGQAALVSIDPRNGAIRAMVGGTDFERNQFNRVTQAQRQPGSTFKPFVYSTAIAGGISPYKTYIDAPIVVDRKYKPNNANKSFKGSVSMQNALTNSINIVAIRILIEAGFQPTIDLARRMGIESRLEPYYALALGALEVNLLEITGAYGSFANYGQHNKPFGILRVTDAAGNVVYEHKPAPNQAISAETSAIMTYLMRGVVSSGTATAAQISRPVAGKTGTTDKAKDLWFIGYVPQLVTGVWLGNDNSRPTGNASSTAAYAWGRFMSTAMKDIPTQPFPDLPNLSGRKPEIKLDPVPANVRTLAVPKKENGEAGNAEERPRRGRRASREESNSEERPTRRRRRG